MGGCRAGLTSHPSLNFSHNLDPHGPERDAEGFLGLQYCIGPVLSMAVGAHATGALRVVVTLRGCGYAGKESQPGRAYPSQGYGEVKRQAVK